MTSSPCTHLQALLQDFGVAMLATRSTSGQLHARPMVIGQVEDCVVWFLTDRHSGKLSEIDHDAAALITLQSTTRYASLTGTLELVDDRERISKLWKTQFRVWFSKGKDDPDITLLRFEGQAGEYWDGSGTSGIKYLIEAGKALVTGHRPEVVNDPRVHAKVNI